MTTILYGYGPISLGDVLTELRNANPNRTYPIALGDADVRALAGIPSGPISLTDLYGKSAVSALTASGHNDYGYQSSSAGGGTVTAFPSVSYAGGSGTKSFQWTVLSSTQPVTLLNATSAQCAVQRGFTKNSNGYITVYLRCVVSDATGSVTVDNIVGELEWAGDFA